MSAWPFKKKHLPKDQLNFSGARSLLQGVIEDRPAIMWRRNLEELKDIVGHPDFPYQVEIVTTCNNPDSNGFQVKMN